MKKIFKKLAVLLTIFSIIYCKSKSNEPIFENNPEQLKRIWMLVEFLNFKKEDLIKNQAQINLTNLKNPSAFMGCNQIGFQIEMKENKLFFTNLIATEMFCGDKMNLENEFSKALTKIYTYNIKGQKLYLTNSKNHKMSFVAQDWD
jgi:heat shock protein HslJ